MGDKYFQVKLMLICNYVSNITIFHSPKKFKANHLNQIMTYSIKKHYKYKSIHGNFFLFVFGIDKFKIDMQNLLVEWY